LILHDTRILLQITPDISTSHYRKDTSIKIESLPDLSYSPTHTMETSSFAYANIPSKEWMAEIWNKVESAVSSLSEEGMFATASYNNEREFLDPEGQNIKIVCGLYFRDTDDEGNPAGLWVCDKQQEAMRDSSGNCTFCGSHAQKPHEEIEQVNTKRRFRCPIKGCGHWAPKHFKAKLYGGIFHIVYGGEAIFEAPYPDKHDGCEGMTNEEQIESIKRVITEEFKDYKYTVF